MLKNIYNKYLNNEINEEELIRCIGDYQIKDVKSNGVIYTPMNIAKQMIEMANPNKDDFIIEPSCGHGIFIISLINFIQQKHNLNGLELLNWFKEKVTGIDISEITIIDLKQILTFFFLKKFNIKINQDFFNNIKCFDGLKYEDNIKYNLCIGNPPYIRAKNLKTDYLNMLKADFVTCKDGTIDIYYAFIEKYSNSCEKLVFIVPNSFLTNKSGETLKESLKDKVVSLINYKEKKVFKDASVFTCILETTLNKNESFFYGDDFNSLSLINKQEFFDNSIKTGNLIHDIYSGIATLSDNVFIVKKVNNKYYVKKTKNGDLIEIESGIVVPLLKLTKIKCEHDLNFIDYIIYPYDENKKILDEVFIKKNYPMAYKHLINSKNILLNRDKGKVDKYESWFAYGRKQGLHHIKAKKILSIPIMLGNNCQPILIDTDLFLKDKKTFVFVSGYIIPYNEKNELACNYIKSKSFLEYAKKCGKIWSGKDNFYYTLSIKQIKSISID